MGESEGFCSRFFPLWRVVSLSVRTLIFKQGKEKSLSATWCSLKKAHLCMDPIRGKEILGDIRDFSSSLVLFNEVPLERENIESSRAIISRVWALSSILSKLWLKISFLSSRNLRERLPSANPTPRFPYHILFWASPWEGGSRRTGWRKTIVPGKNELVKKRVW